MGANVALDFAVSHPQRVTALVHVNGGMSGVAVTPSQVTLQYMAAALVAAQNAGDMVKAADLFVRNPALFGTLAENSPAALEKVRSIVIENSQAFLNQRGGFRPAAISPTAAARLSALRMQVLLIVGENNEQYGHDVALKLETEVVGSRRIVVPGTGHMVNMEKPDEFNRLLLDFLRGIEF